MRDHYELSDSIPNPYAKKLKEQITIRLDAHVKRRYHSMKAEKFDQKFDANEGDILDDLDLSTVSRPNQTQKKS